MITVTTYQQFLSFFERYDKNIDRFPLFSAVYLDYGNKTLAFSCDPNNNMSTFCAALEST
jgi:hypothetical protein